MEPSGTRLPISLVVVAMNEERILSRCLQAADFCTEMIVVDSGSTDRTVEIARASGARVIHHEWHGYRDQKHFAVELATQPWVLAVDADEVITPELRRSILEAFREPPAVDAFELNRRSYYAGRRIGHSGWYPQWRLMLFRKGKVEWCSREPHEVLVAKSGRCARLKGDLDHYTYTDIRHHVMKNVSYAHAWARDAQRMGKRARVADLVLRGPWAFFRTYVLQRGFLDGFYGLVIAAVAAFYTFSKYAMLREMNRRGDAV